MAGSMTLDRAERKGPWQSVGWRQADVTGCPGCLIERPLKPLLMGIKLALVTVKLPEMLGRDVLDQELDGFIPVLIRSLGAHGCHEGCLASQG